MRASLFVLAILLSASTAEAANFVGLKYDPAKHCVTTEATGAAAKIDSVRYRMKRLVKGRYLWTKWTVSYKPNKCWVPPAKAGVLQARAWAGKQAVLNGRRKVAKFEKRIGVIAVPKAPPAKKVKRKPRPKKPATPTPPPKVETVIKIVEKTVEVPAPQAGCPGCVDELRKEVKTDLGDLRKKVVEISNRPPQVVQQVVQPQQPAPAPVAKSGIGFHIYPMVQGFLGPRGNFHLESLLIGPRFVVNDKIQLRLAAGLGTDFKSNPSFLTEGAIGFFPTAGRFGFEVVYGYSAYSISSKTYMAMAGQSHIVSARFLARVAPFVDLFIGAGGGIRTLNKGTDWTGGFVLSAGASFNLPW